MVAQTEQRERKKKIWYRNLKKQITKQAYQISKRACIHNTILHKTIELTMTTTNVVCNRRGGNIPRTLVLDATDAHPSTILFTHTQNASICVCTCAQCHISYTERPKPYDHYDPSSFSFKLIL